MQELVDAKIICSSSGGTKEIAGLNSIIIIEEEWDFKPVKLYEPPIMDFSFSLEGNIDSNIDIESCSMKYLEVFKGII